MNPELEFYLEAHSDAEPTVLQELSRDTQSRLLNGRMVSGHLQGRVLVMLCRMIKPMKVLELGTFTGYSALCFAEGSPEGAEIHTFEINDELEDNIRLWLSRSEFGSKVHVHIGDANALIPPMEQVFDLAFIDSDKRDYIQCYETVLPKIRPGGFILVDNTLWYGKVVTGFGPNDAQSLAISEFNDYLANDSSVEKVILPLRDGLTLIHKKH